MNEIVEIRKCDYKELLPLRCLQKESVDMSYNINTTYLGYFENGQILGVVGYQIIGKKIRYKTDGVLASHRGKGIYSKLFAFRDNICNQLGYESFTAFCTSKSLGMYLGKGFEIKSKKGKITFVEKRL